jgi:AcrR family transcriptional regulator
MKWCATLLTMGNREALLAGAMTCLVEKGYSRTTARDIATAAGTSLAAIGYHYGTTENLLNQAVFTAMERWGDVMGARVRANAQSGQQYRDRFVDVVSQIIASIHDDRPIWEASFDLLAQSRHVPDVAETLRTAMHGARTGNVAMFDAVDEETVDEHQERTLGAFYYSLTIGLVVQWLIDPASAPTADDIAEALQMIAPRIATEP